MPAIRTDDGPRRLRAVWLGPKGVRWPVDWTYVQWSVFAVLVLAVPWLLFLLLVWLSPWVASAAALVLGPWVAWEITTRLPGWVDYDRPVRFWWWVLRAEFSRSVRVSRLRETWVRPVLPSGVGLTSGGRHLLYPPVLRVRGSREGTS
jgi:hypothetical protein